MKLNVLLSIAAIVTALVGIAFLLVPATMQYGTLGANPSAAQLAVVRATASLFIAIALLDWAARNAEPSTARNAIVLANAVGFGTAAILLALAVFSGADKTALIPVVINLVISIAFIMAGRASMSAKAG
jgi:hypothetical protein